jgi:hypothetical protein
MCIPADSMLWALVARIRDEGHAASEADLRALLRSGCSRQRAYEVLSSEGHRHADRPFADALTVLERLT